MMMVVVVVVAVFANVFAFCSAMTHLAMHAEP